MPNYLVIEIAVDDAIVDINAQRNIATKQYESVNGCIDLLTKIIGGNKPASVKIVGKDATTTIATSGTGSASNTFSF